MALGVVPQFDQRKIDNIWAPIIGAISQDIDCKIVLKGSKNIPEFEQKFKKGMFDIAYMNPYHAIVANDTQGYTPILRSGKKMLQGVLVARKDANISDLKDLDGAELAFPSPNALGASLLMRAELFQKFGVTIRPKYVRTHSSVYLHVFKKILPGGGGVQRTLNQQKDVIRDQFRVIYKTTKVPAHPIVLHPRIKEEKRDRITNALLRLAKRQKDVFERIPMSEPIETSISDYQLLRGLNLEKFAE